VKVPKQFLRPGPPNPSLEDRKAEFDDINRYVCARHGWVTSVRGESEVRFECLEGPLPDELRAGAAFKLGGRMMRLPKYDVTADGEGERIVTGAGIVRVSKFRFDLP
jgi:hypothetical protein